MTAPALVLVRAPLDRVIAGLLAMGATAQNRRSRVFDLGEHLILVEYDADDHVSVVAVGGPEVVATAAWIAAQLEDFGCAIGTVLPPLNPVG